MKDASKIHAVLVSLNLFRLWACHICGTDVWSEHAVSRAALPSGQNAVTISGSENGQCMFVCVGWGRWWISRESEILYLNFVYSLWNCISYVSAILVGWVWSVAPPFFSLSLEHLPRWFGHCGNPEFESEFTAILVSCNLLYTSPNAFLWFLTMALACGLRAPWPGSEPVPLVLGACSLDHWTSMSLNVMERGAYWESWLWDRWGCLCKCFAWHLVGAQWLQVTVPRWHYWAPSVSWGRYLMCGHAKTTGEDVLVRKHTTACQLKPKPKKSRISSRITIPFMSDWVRSLGREAPGGGHGNALQYSCLDNPMDRGAWWATVHRVSKSPTQLNDLAHTSDWRVGDKVDWKKLGWNLAGEAPSSWTAFWNPLKNPELGWGSIVRCVLLAGIKPYMESSQFAWGVPFLRCKERVCSWQVKDDQRHFVDGVSCSFLFNFLVT